jgi:hypothetical protein
MKKNDENFFYYYRDSNLRLIVLYLSTALPSADELYTCYSDLHIYTQKSHDHARDHENFIFNTRLRWY